MRNSLFPNGSLTCLIKTREVLENRRCLRLPSWFEVHERRIMERFANVQWNHPFGKCCKGAIHRLGRLPPVPGCDLPAAD